MKNKTYQLTKLGIDRLEQFKRDFDNGECKIESHGFYYTVSNRNYIACCFVSDEIEIADDIKRQFDLTMSGDIEVMDGGYGVPGGFVFKKDFVEVVNA